MADVDIIEALTDDDQAACFAIRRAVFVDEQGVSEADEVDGEDPICRHFLATVDGAPIGAARLKPIEGAMKVQRVAVLPAARGTGLGAALMRRMIDDVAARHPGLPIVLGSQIDAVRFYEKLGFIAEGEEYLDAGIRHLDMRLTPKR